MERLVEMCSLERYLLHNVNMTDGQNEELIPCCAMEILISFAIVPRHLKVYVSRHASVLLVFHEMRKIWKQLNLRRSLVRPQKTFT